MFLFPGDDGDDSCVDADAGVDDGGFDVGSVAAGDASTTFKIDSFHHLTKGDRTFLLHFEVKSGSSFLYLVAFTGL